MIRVAQVRKGSIGADLDIQVGSSLLRLNGEELRDALDLQYLEAAELVELEAELPGGRHVTYEIEKDGSESLGLVPEADEEFRAATGLSGEFQLRATYLRRGDLEQPLARLERGPGEAERKTRALPSSEKARAIDDEP